jgi:glycine cleavage system H protein
VSEGAAGKAASEQDAAGWIAGDDRFFMMGEFKAILPAGLRYTTNHMWASPAPVAPAADDPAAADNGSLGRWRFGLSAYAVRLLQDVYFLDWLVEAPATVSRRQQLGSIESKKAESDLYSPAAGTLVTFNPEALSDPSVINVDIYGDGWLFEMSPDDSSELLDIEDYLAHLENAWGVAQRTIKGQI